MLVVALTFLNWLLVGAKLKEVEMSKCTFSPSHWLSIPLIVHMTMSLLNLCIHHDLTHNNVQDVDVDRNLCQQLMI